MINSELLPLLLVFGAGLLVTCVLGLLLGRRGRRQLVTAAEVAQSRVARLEHLIKEQAREHSEQRAAPQNKSQALAGMALSLPTVVRELNRDDLDFRKVPGLILNLAESIFQPEQLLFYVAATSRTERGRKELVLVQQRGLGEVPPSIRTVPFGVGRIGWVAEHRLDKMDGEWSTLARNDGVAVGPNHPSLKLDIVGPLVHHTLDGEQVLGVICVGNPRIRIEDEKLMFQMVTNLGSLALVNARNVRALREQANHDGLTGLLNKRYFMRRLGDLMLNASREAQKLGVFIFDIDHFKTYNDTNGHPAGDQLLRGLAALLRESIRPDDLCCRYGGEEFMVALPQTDGDEALEIADRLRQIIQQHVFEHEEKQPLGDLTISGGLAIYPKDGQQLGELIQHADEALYESKRGGRNRVTPYRCVEFGDLQEGSDVDLFPTHPE